MRHFVKLSPLNLTKVFTQRGYLLSPALLSQILGRLDAIKAYLQTRFIHKKPHPLLWAVFAITFVCICLNYWLIPSISDLESKLALRPAQWAQLENLIRLSKSTTLQVSSAEPMDEVELQRIRMLLAAKGIKPAVLRLSLENPPKVELQMSEVVFSNAVDVLEEMRKTWGLYPENIEISATPKLSVINLNANLRQMGALNSTVSFSDIAGGQSR